MLRDSSIPLALWLPAAILFHAATGGTAHETAKVYQERMDILRFARGVRTEVRLALRGETTEVQLLDEQIEPAEPDDEDKIDDPDVDAEDEGEEDDDVAKRRGEERGVPEVTADKPQPKPDDKAPDPEKTPVLPPEPSPPQQAKRPEKQPEKKKIVVVKPPKEKKDKTQQIEIKPDGRIAVINDPTLKKDQKDNPNAKRIADHANTTDEEKQARFRSYDQNSPNPNGGGKSSPSHDQNPGNAGENKRGFSTESPGTGSPRAGADAGADKRVVPTPQRKAGPPKSQGSGRKAIAARKGAKSVEVGKGKIVPRTVTGKNGEPWISPEGGDDRKKRTGRKGRKGSRGQRGVPGPIIAGLPKRYSAGAGLVQDALGKKQLIKEQERARNTRLRKHRGKFKGADFKKYRAAIENYDPKVKPGNQTSLNAAHKPFASYINKMHNRIHPIFADGFLGSLGGLDPTDRLANMKLVTHIEMILDGKTGKLVAAGIVRPSGVTALEIGALRSLEDAGPFGKPPSIIVSPDGKVYIHWEFYRNPYYACTSRFARPFILKNPPKKNTHPPKRKPPHRHGEGHRYGQRGPLRPERK